MFGIAGLMTIYMLIFGCGHYLASTRHVGALLHYFLLTVDLMAITAAIRITGNSQSPLFVLFTVLLSAAFYNGTLFEFVFSAVLGFVLYTSLLFSFVSGDPERLPQTAGQILLLATLMGVHCVIFHLLNRERKAKRKLVSCAKALSRISDVLGASTTDSREKMRTISRILEEEFRRERYQCRLYIYKGHQQFVPPSGSQSGIHIPLMAGHKIFGVLIVTPPRPTALTPQENDFFFSVARSIGIALRRDMLWEEFQSQLQKVEASLLLNSFRPSMDFNNGFGYPEHWAVENMLEKVRMERGKWQIQQDPCNLRQIVTEEIQKVKTMANEKKLRIDIYETDDLPPTIIADGSKIKQLVANLIHNSVLRSPSEGRIFISLKDDSGALVFVCEDEGPTIPAEKTETLFQSYTSPLPAPDGSPRRVEDLSLEICKEIVDAHKGRIWVESKGEGPGNRWLCKLPLQRDFEKGSFSQPLA